MTAALIVAGAFAALVAVLWIVGSRERAFAIAIGDPQWFIALRGQGGALAPGVRENWRSSADFTVIGPEDPYWHRFIIASGGDATGLPLSLDGVEDAYVARVKLRRPPPLVLGLLKALVSLGILSKPHGAIVQDAQALSFRADVMPSAANISRLLAKPATYSPAMVNFLAYHSDAQYRGGSNAISGRAAYMHYGIVAMRTVYRTGGHLLFSGRILSVLREAESGPARGRWDDIAAMRYPNPPAILSMEHAPDYHAALDDRDAGLERTLVIATTPAQ